MAFSNSELTLDDLTNGEGYELPSDVQTGYGTGINDQPSDFTLLPWRELEIEFYYLNHFPPPPPIIPAVEPSEPAAATGETAGFDRVHPVQDAGHSVQLLPSVQPLQYNEHTPAFQQLVPISQPLAPYQFIQPAQPVQPAQPIQPVAPNSASPIPQPGPDTNANTPGNGSVQTNNKSHRRAQKNASQNRLRRRLSWLRSNEIRTPEGKEISTALEARHALLKIKAESPHVYQRIPANVQISDHELHKQPAGKGTGRGTGRRRS